MHRHLLLPQGLQTVGCPSHWGPTGPSPPEVYDSAAVGAEGCPSSAFRDASPAYKLKIKSPAKVRVSLLAFSPKLHLT